MPQIRTLRAAEDLRALQSQGRSPRAADGKTILTVVPLPDVDGRRVAAAVKAASSDTPVVLLTGWGQRLTAENQVPPHVDRVLNKPPRLRELRAALAGARAQPLTGELLRLSRVSYPWFAPPGCWQFPPPR